jgi:hypothetical protein
MPSRRACQSGPEQPDLPLISGNIRHEGVQHDSQTIVKQVI